MSLNEVEQLILSIGKELGRNEDEMKGYVDIIVNKNWYDKLELLKDITNDQWESMNIPLRLVDIIKSRVGDAKVEDKTSDDGVKTMIEKDEWEFEYLTPENIDIAPSLYNSIESLNFIEKESLKGVTDTLFKIIDSIIKEPKKGKIRRIRMNNPKFASTVGKHNQALNVLKSVGFVHINGKNGDNSLNNQINDDSYIELPVAYISRLTDCHHLLASLCEKNKIEAPKLVSNDHFIYNNNSIKVNNFNPYISNILSTSVDSKNESSKRLMEYAVEERYKVEVEIKKREKDIESGSVGDDSENYICSEPIAFHSSELVNKCAKSDSKNKDQYEKDQDFDIQYLDKSYIQKIKDTIDGKKSTFKSRSNEYLKTLQNKKIYTHTCIKIIFPDKYILQLEFKPNNTTYDLIETVKTCINPNIVSMDWFVYQSPPVVKVVPDKKMLLIKAGFVPNAQLYFKLELPPNHKLQGNYLKSELINKKR
ncbi:N-glycanase [Cryptosporidium xiaoi]|uniref:N-glycanase n=1 Tax=Cryptosporidium xiaoi TaxID=659607 RepID=A0AAV9XWK2_9CRYT